MTIDSEVWRYVRGTLDYEVSNLGRVRRVNSDVFMKIGKHNKSSRVKLQIRTRPKYIYVHRMVAAAFLPDFQEDDGLIFIDGDRFNCRVDNLKIKDRASGRINRRLPKDILVEVVETGEKYPSLSATARAIGGQDTNVNRVLQGTLNHHKGFTFRYVKA